jgi:pimeloyl-ACP methyl ester carboxylesterase
VVDNFSALFRQPPMLPHLYQLWMPTLLLHGARSPEPTRRIVERLAGALPLARTRTIAGAGHMAPLSHADQINAAIVSFLRPGHRPRPVLRELELAA